MTTATDYRQMWRQTLVRLLLTYLAPLLILTVYFTVQSRSLIEESRDHHLQSIAESQAGTFELFLRERLVNLRNLVDDPSLPARPAAEAMDVRLERLRRDSDTFVDLGVFDGDGTLVSYAGPFPSLLGQEYGNESWFRALATSPEGFVITDLYLGFRGRPHFTIAVWRSASEGPAVVRATLDPERIGEYITTLRGEGEVTSVLVSAAGSYQSVNLPPVLAATTPHVPPRAPAVGALRIDHSSGHVHGAYSWLTLTDWALLVIPTGASPTAGGEHSNPSLIAVSAALVLAVLSAILIRARKVVREQRRQDATRLELSGQLRHAARLASVGELAAGVAHEINNPLAVIAEEAGLMRDLLDIDGKVEPGEARLRLDSIHEAVFRARDITRQLLSFVRKSDIRLAELDLNRVVEDVVGGILEHELHMANIEVIRSFAEDLPQVMADRNQLEQVLINLVTNSADAIEATGRGSGRITIVTGRHDDFVRLAVTDDGTGIAPEHLERIFMPFHTTKDVGKGTGLGLSVSYGIVQSHGGDIVVDSTPGFGSTFTVMLPVNAAHLNAAKETRHDHARS